VIFCLRIRRLWNAFSWLVLILIFGFGTAFSQPTIFVYTGGMQTYTVASGITSLAVDVRGAHGGRDYFDSGRGGYGGRVQCILAVTPGQVLNVFVGGAGNNGVPVSGPNYGGYNGGGTSCWLAGSGGGASDIRSGGTALTNRIVVAGGGGGGGLYSYVPDTRGGDGGGTVGEHGYLFCAQG